MATREFSNQRPRDGGTGRFMPQTKTRPADFERTFIRIGRVACEEHYHVSRLAITAWLNDCGKAELIALRAEFVKRKEAERRQRDRLNRREMGKVLGMAFPVDQREVAPELARDAAQFLRIKRNGGWAVSPTMSGGWIVGVKRMSAAELVDMAILGGFTPSLTGDGSTAR